MRCSALFRRHTLLLGSHGCEMVLSGDKNYVVTDGSWTSSCPPRLRLIISTRGRSHLLKAAKVRLGRFRISLETRTIFTILMMSTAVGPIRGLVFGAFGEISEEARTLLCYAADTTAARTWVEDGATSQEHAAALLKNRLYHRWGIKTARECARIKIEGLRLVGGNPGLGLRPRRNTRGRDPRYPPRSRLDELRPSWTRV